MHAADHARSWAVTPPFRTTSDTIICLDFGSSAFSSCILAKLLAHDTLVRRFDAY